MKEYEISSELIFKGNLLLTTFGDRFLSIFVLADRDVPKMLLRKAILAEELQSFVFTFKTFL